LANSVVKIKGYANLASFAFSLENTKYDELKDSFAKIDKCKKFMQFVECCKLKKILALSLK
jgi:hypothetical protein